MIGVAAAIASPAARALRPRARPGRAARRTRWRCARSPSRSAMVAGPALGGSCSRSGPSVVYGVAAELLVAAALVCDDRDARARRPQGRVGRPSPGLDSLLAGIRFIRAHARDARGDHARPLRGALRRRGRAAARCLRARSCTPGRSASAMLRSAPAVGALAAGADPDPPPAASGAPARRCCSSSPPSASAIDRLRALALTSRSRSSRSRSAASSTCSASTSAARSRSLADAERAARPGDSRSRTSSSAPRTSSARSSRAPPRRCSGRCPPSSPAAR